MRHPVPDERPVALTVAGSDSGGGAGIQADLATMASHGAYGTSAITAVTAQHTRGVESSHVLPRAEVAAQVDAVVDDFDVAAAKTGMLATNALVELVAERAADWSFPLVVDPVMVATAGDRLLDREAERAYESLLAEAALVTPNADEATVLTGIEITDEADARQAGEALRELGADAALVKGGHVPGETVRDVLVSDAGVTVLEHDRVETDASHGSGCTLSAAIAARLAAGDGLREAVERGTDAVAAGIRYHYDVGRGPGAVNHCVGLRDAAAREPTADAVRRLAERLADATAIDPPEGLAVAGSTPYAESLDDVAVVTGGFTPTESGLEPPDPVRFDASNPAAEDLLEARERDGRLRFAVRCRLDDAEAALDDHDWSVIAGDPDGDVVGRIERAGTAGERPLVLVEDDQSSGDRAVTVTATEATTAAELVCGLLDRVE